MQSFKDGQGRDWQVVVDVDAIERIQEQTGIDFGEPGAFEKAFADTKTFAGVLWCLLSEEAGERQLGPREVKRGLDTADVVAAARDAVVEELIRFFPKAAPSLRRLDQVIRERETVIQTRAQTELDKLTAAMARGDLDGLLIPGPKRQEDVERLTEKLRTALAPSNSAIDSEELSALSPVI